MTRSLGIDLGRRRTGLAISDEAGITCSPLEVLEERDEKVLLLRLMETARAHEVQEMIVGLPRPLAGGTNEQLETVLAFVARLRSVSDIPVFTWDERFTTKLAAGGKVGKSHYDSVAACYMLQNYLDSRATHGGDT